jgi:Flp pilus assembly protein TadD
VKRPGKALATASGLLLAGCVSAGSPRDLGSAERNLRAQGFDPEGVVIPYEITPEMRAWVRLQVASGQPEQRLDQLLRALLDPALLGLKYETGTTRTATDAFTAKRANCLGFTSLFVGMAREIGIDAYYLGVDDVERFERDGDLLVISGHVSAGFDLGGGRRKILEFTNAPKTEYRRTRRLRDATAIALFHSNKGAEALRSGAAAPALPWLRKAVIIDPELGDAWVNLGVGLRRTGDLAGAERAYRTALEIAPATVSAYHNLASLLRAGGHGAEADEILGVGARIRDRDPFTYLALGDVAFTHGRLEEARRYYRKASALYRDDAEPYAAHGQVACATGRFDEGLKWWKKAAGKGPGVERVRKLEATLRSHGRL